MTLIESVARSSCPAGQTRALGPQTGALEQQQIEIHELRCSVRKYKTMLDNMQDEIRMIRQILDKKWMASPRSGRAGDGGYYNDKEGGKQRWRGGDTAITHE
eukprot:56427-Amorphochlora_amoeboformis.AAC.1